MTTTAGADESAKSLFTCRCRDVAQSRPYFDARAAHFMSGMVGALAGYCVRALCRAAFTALVRKRSTVRRVPTGVSMAHYMLEEKGDCGMVKRVARTYTHPLFGRRIQHYLELEKAKRT